jgi:hypothetical protein
MFVLSKNQFDLLTRGLGNRSWRSSVVTDPRPASAAADTTTLLDLGAGDGRPTLAMSGGFARVLATEVSGPMQRRLAEKGFHVVDIDQWVRPATYDMIRKDAPLPTVIYVQLFEFFPGPWILMLLCSSFQSSSHLHGACPSKSARGFLFNCPVHLLFIVSYNLFPPVSVFIGPFQL